MFNAYNFGGYLVWAGAPQHKVFIDGRGELFEPSGVLPDYMHITLLRPGGSLRSGQLWRSGGACCARAMPSPMCWRCVIQTGREFIRTEQASFSVGKRTLAPSSLRTYF